MSKRSRLRRRVWRATRPRYEEFRARYLEHRRRAETLVQDHERYSGIVLADLAAGQAALTLAWEDGVIGIEDFAWLMEVYSAVLTVILDADDECCRGFEVAIAPPLSRWATQEQAEEFVGLAQRARRELRQRIEELELFHELALWELGLLPITYWEVTGSVVLWARSRRGMSASNCVSLRCYFGRMLRIIEDEELGLPELAEFLSEALDGDVEPGHAGDCEWW